MFFFLFLLCSLLLLFLISFYDLKYTHKRYHDPLIIRLKEDLVMLEPRIAKIHFYSSEEESFTEDKNKIFICLRDKDGRYYDYNMLIYVAIHECSHALTDVIDIHHTTPEFKGMFNSLLEKAEEKGLYDRKKPLIKNYCGINLHTENMMR